MKVIDMRFNKEILKGLIGKSFNKYTVDPVVFSNTSTGIVGMTIDDRTFAINNMQENVDYFGNNEECGIFKFVECQDVSSFFLDIKQTDIHVNEKIVRITIIDENQRIMRDDICLYDVWLTRGIIFHFNEHEVSFQKDIVPFSEEIIIRRGQSLIEKFDGTDEFVEGWEDCEGYTPNIQRQIVVID